MKRYTCMLLAGLLAVAVAAEARTVKPPLHGRNWMAVTGKPLAATAGARTFLQGGNAVDAACAMIAATSTMWDTAGALAASSSAWERPSAPRIPARRGATRADFRPEP